MDIHYCDKCKARIPEGDLSTGLAFITQEGNLYCSSCWRQEQERGRGSAEPSAQPLEVAELEVAELDEVTAPVPPAQPASPRDAQPEVPEQIEVPAPRAAAPPLERAKTRLQPRLRKSARATRISAVGRRAPPRKRGTLWPALGGLAVGLTAVAVAIIAGAPSYFSGEDAGGRTAAEDGEIDKPAVAAPVEPRPAPLEGAAGGPAEKELPTMEEAARNKFDEIAVFVEAGELGKAEELFEAYRAHLVATEYEGRAEALLLGARVKLAIVESRKLAAEAKYDEALALVEKALVRAIGSRHAGTLKDVDTLKELREEYRRATEKLAAEKRREEAERLKREKWKALMASAKQKAGEGEFEAALKLLTEAKKLLDLTSTAFGPASRQNEEVAAEIISVTFDMHVRAGREHLEAGRHARAIAAFEKALEVKRDADLAQEIAGLRNLAKFNELYALAERRAARGDGTAAIGVYREAKKLAPDDEALRRVESAIRELQFRAALADAEKDIRARRWKRAESAAVWALELKPDSSRAREILATARRGLAPRKRRLRDRAGIDLVLVPEGVFTMGTDDGPAEARPAREVRLDDYYIGATEVTNGQYELFAPDHERRRGRHSPGDDHPVTNVTYEEAVAFCKWLSKTNKTSKTGNGPTYRLPTEAEWERAARGSDGRRYPWGDERPAAGKVYRCNFGMRARKGWGRDGFVSAAPVGSFPDWASPAGCLDMAGNVAEWCLSATGEKAVTRGGSWQSAAPQVTATARSSLRRGKSAATVGFRVVRGIGAVASGGGTFDKWRGSMTLRPACAAEAALVLRSELVRRAASARRRPADPARLPKSVVREG